MAPEVIKKSYDEKCDVWSCGVLLFMLLSGTPPFNGRAAEEILVKIERGRYTLEGEEWNSVSESAKKYIKRLLEYDPKKRITAKEALNDEWIVKNKAEAKLKIPSFNAKIGDELLSVIGLYSATDLGIMEVNVKLAELFYNLDTKRDGVLDLEELSNVFPIKIVEKLILDFDYNGNGVIDYSEFLAANFVFDIKSLDAQHEVFQLFSKVKNRSRLIGLYWRKRTRILLCGM